MKKQLYKLITTFLIALAILSITQVAVYAQEETEISLLKTGDESYIIYVKDLLSTEFLFSFSENKEALEADLTFSASGIDSNENNVAYITKELAENLKNGEIYMLVKAEEKLTTYSIDINQAVTSDEITFVNSTTKRIEVDTDKTKKTAQDANGVKITHSQGKIVITEAGEAFSYYMEKVASEETTKFVELANQIITAKNASNYERVTLARQFTDTYNQKLNKIDKWQQVPTSKEILQPQESNKNDTYLVWLKNDITGEHDVQILICDEHQDIKVEEAKKVTVYETTKLPVTYDSIITLIIILSILVAVIIALVVIRKKLNKKDN